MFNRENLIVFTRFNQDFVENFGKGQTVGIVRRGDGAFLRQVFEQLRGEVEVFAVQPVTDQRQFVVIPRAAGVLTEVSAELVARRALADASEEIREEELNVVDRGTLKPRDEAMSKEWIGKVIHHFDKNTVEVGGDVEGEIDEPRIDQALTLLTNLLQIRLEQNGSQMVDCSI